MARKERASYEEASAFAKNEGITTQSQWKARAKAGLPENIRYDPQRTYQEEFKNGGWGRFLGTGTVAPQNRQFVTYEEASAFAQKEGITTQTQWRARAKAGLPERFPHYPQQTYQEEFKNGGWGRFLGTGTVATFNRKYASYEEASAFAQKEGITNASQWMARVKQGLPEHIPASLWTVYEEEFKNGGLGRFLGLKNHPQESKIERSLRYSLEQAFGEPVPFSSNPKVRGASRTWRVDAFLQEHRLVVEYDGGRYHLNKEHKDTLKTQDLLAAGYHVVRIRGSTSQHALKALREGWDLVIDEKQTHVTQIALVLEHLISLAAQRLLILKPETLSRLGEWKKHELHKVEFRTVLEEYDGFVSYEEASAFAKKEGIATQSQWNSCSKQGFPRNIPSNPQKCYAKEFENGGWGRFLGTGTIAPQNRQFVTYEEASAFAQKEGITTVAQWRARVKQGLPTNIPADPWGVYEEEFRNGGTKRFLATGPFAKQPAPEILPPAPPAIPEMPSLSQWRAQRNAAPTAPQQPRVAPKRPKP